MNYFKTFALIFLLSALFTLIGFAIGGINGAIIALLISFVLNFFTYWKSDTLVLTMMKAEKADPVKHRYFYDITANLTQKANLPMPALYIMQNDMPNAFATGRNPQHSAVALTSGIIALLSKDELAGVIAHELAHIKNRDTLISTITASIASAISMIANIFMYANLFASKENRVNPIVSILVMFIAPLAASIIQMAISRNREYAADKLGGEIVGNPIYLANALSKLENYNKRKTHEDVTPSTAHMFIINPLSGNKNQTSMDGLFSTHPNTSNRINNLVKQALEMGFSTNSVKYSDNFIEKNTNSFNNNPWGDTNDAPTDVIWGNNTDVSEKPKDYNTPNNPWK